MEAGLSWTEDRVALLRRLWEDGQSASKIAAQLGGVTRNAVIGKVHRLGLGGRIKAGEDAPIANPRAAEIETAIAVVEMEAPEPVAILAHRPAPEFAQPAPAPEPVALAVSQRVTIMDLRESMCRWPIGDPTTPEFRFCGDRSITGLPYCTHHAEIAYQPAAERRRDRRVGGFR